MRGFRVWGFGFRVWGFRVWGFGGLGFRVLGLEPNHEHLFISWGRVRGCRLLWELKSNPYKLYRTRVEGPCPFSAKKGTVLPDHP